MSDEFTLDMLDIPSSWNRGEGDWMGVAAAIAKGETVEVIQEVGSTLWQNSLPEKHSLYWEGENQSPIKGRIWISFTQRRFAPESALPKVQWHPRVLWIGIGCNAGTSRELIETAIQSVCRAYHLAEGAIAGIATIDTKVSEVGLVELCCLHHWPLKTFPWNILRTVSVPNPSEIIEKAMGTPSVAEAAALCATLNLSHAKTSHLCAGVIPVEETGASRSEGVNPILLVPKQVFRLQGEPGSVTVAVAECLFHHAQRHQ